GRCCRMDSNGRGRGGGRLRIAVRNSVTTMATPPNPLLAARSSRADGRVYEFEGHRLTITRGHPLPLGATLTPAGVNFVLLCRHGTAVTLVLSQPCSSAIAAEIPLDPRNNRTGDYWHVRVNGLPDQFCYGYRVDGPKGVGDRYDPRVVLLDPAAR